MLTGCRLGVITSQQTVLLQPRFPASILKYLVSSFTCLPRSLTASFPLLFCTSPPPPPPPCRQGPSLQDVLDEGEYELQALPSDEAWFGEPDPAVYAPGTNDLSKEQLEAEVAKGNVVTLRQLKQHLLTATDQELEVGGGESEVEGVVGARLQLHLGAVAGMRE